MIFSVGVAPSDTDAFFCTKVWSEAFAPDEAFSFIEQY